MLSRLNITLHTFVILTIVSVILVAAASVFYVNFSYDQERQKLSTRIATSSVRLSRAVLSVAENPDKKQIHSIISAFAASPEVQCVKASLRKNNFVDYWPNKNCDQEFQEDFLHVQPLRRGVKVLGEVNVYFTDDVINSNISETILTVQIGIAILLSSLLIAMIATQRRIVQRPISRIVSALKRVRDGETDHRIGDLEAAPEFQRIAVSFDEMAADIAAKDIKVRSQELKLKENNRDLAENLDEARELHTKLTSMADEATSMNELLRTQSAELKIRNEENRQNLAYAARFQHRLTTLDDSSKFGLDIFGDARQLNKIGGDFFVGMDLGDRYAIFFADGTGHGVSGALATMFLSMAVRNALQLSPTSCPSEQLADIHMRLANGLQNRLTREEEVGLGADATLLHYIKSEEKIVWASAKQPFIICSDGTATMTEADRQSIGYEVIQKKFNSFQHRFSDADDAIIMFTDGISDAPGGAKGFGFGKRRLLHMVENANDSDKDSAGIGSAIFSAVNKHLAGREPFDDMTVLVIKRVKVVV